MKIWKQKTIIVGHVELGKVRSMKWRTTKGIKMAATVRSRKNIKDIFPLSSFPFYYKNEEKQEKDSPQIHNEIKKTCRTVSDSEWEQWCKFNLTFNKHLGKVELLWEVTPKHWLHSKTKETMVTALWARTFGFKLLSHMRRGFEMQFVLPEFYSVDCWNWNQIDRTPISQLSAHVPFHDGGVGLLEVLQSHMHEHTQETGTVELKRICMPVGTDCTFKNRLNTQKH